MEVPVDRRFGQQAGPTNRPWAWPVMPQAVAGAWAAPGRARTSRSGQTWSVSPVATPALARRCKCNGGTLLPTSGRARAPRSLRCIQRQAQGSMHQAEVVADQKQQRLARKPHRRLGAGQHPLPQGRQHQQEHRHRRPAPKEDRPMRLQKIPPTHPAVELSPRPRRPDDHSPRCSPALTNHSSGTPRPGVVTDHVQVELVRAPRP
jgi:hypothetical protein